MAVRLFLVTCFALLSSIGSSPAQIAPNDSEQPVRVNVTVNPDGTRTTYQFDQAHHQATATTATAEGKITGKIDYIIDEAGRFSSGMVYGPDNKFLFKSAYKYSSSGRLEEETRLNKDDSMNSRLVFSYDSNGRQSGYVVYDAAGKVVGQTTPLQAPPPAQKEKPGKKKAK